MNKVQESSDSEGRKVLPLPEIELYPLGRPARIVTIPTSMSAKDSNTSI
jgi:hypothetical protein